MLPRPLLALLAALAACGPSSAFSPPALALRRAAPRGRGVCAGGGGRRALALRMAAAPKGKWELELDWQKYPPLFLAGGLCAMITHGVTVPLDLIKTSQQVHPGVYNSVGQGLRAIYAEQGVFGLFLGFSPTAVGYLLQGALKYGFYEFFKDVLAQLTRKEGEPKSGKLPVPQMIVSGAAAEMLGTTALLPFESTRIRMISDPSVTGMFEVLSKEIAERGLDGLYSGFVPIMFKQIPFTVTQFLVFEFIASALYKQLEARGDGGEGGEKAAAKFGTAITIGAGVLAGISASLVSQPGDTILSVMTNAHELSLLGAIDQLGATGLFLGADTRVLHVTAYITTQFLIYDSIKRLVGIPVAGQKPQEPVVDFKAETETLRR